MIVNQTQSPSLDAAVRLFDIELDLVLSSRRGNDPAEPRLSSTILRQIIGKGERARVLPGLSSEHRAKLDNILAVLQRELKNCEPEMPRSVAGRISDLLTRDFNVFLLGMLLVTVGAIGSFGTISFFPQPIAFGCILASYPLMLVAFSLRRVDMDDTVQNSPESFQA